MTAVAKAHMEGVPWASISSKRRSKRIRKFRASTPFLLGQGNHFFLALSLRLVYPVYHIRTRNGMKEGSGLAKPLSISSRYQSLNCSYFWRTVFGEKIGNTGYME